MLSLWTDAPHSVELCAVPAGAGDPVVEVPTRVESAEIRTAFPGIGGELAPSHLSVGMRTVPLSATGLYDRCTASGQGRTQTTDNRTNTAR